jgi:hypothetical protein
LKRHRQVVSTACFRLFSGHTGGETELFNRMAPAK